ncbi:hypothetical protein FA95DRAFT_1366924 [Auriscalpium vulgare]|uniref:Uncharacterized protein n=1 Tax=Auriscalpium vulgare TaxID=40419 RepID=A0ACB8R121_9AGAM|nr:hypothetical protein FA95DRAFT_1366924 [Auriscalpium vulgare]
MSGSHLRWFKMNANSFTQIRCLAALRCSASAPAQPAFLGAARVCMIGCEAQVPISNYPHALTECMHSTRYSHCHGASS